MSNQIQVHTQENSTSETVDYHRLVFIGGLHGGASPTNLAGHDNCWSQPMDGSDGVRYVVTYSFSAAEIAECKEDEGQLPWDVDHVVRIARDL